MRPGETEKLANQLAPYILRKIGPRQGGIGARADSGAPADVMAQVLAQDGAGSDLDADLLDGNHASAFLLNSLLTTKGDIIIASAASTPARYGVSAPAANILNVLGVANGEDTPTWKALFDATNPATLTVAAAAAPGTSLLAAHRDHVHLITSSSNPGAAASLLASNASGQLQLVGLIAGYVRPGADATNAIQLQTAGGTAILTADTTNSRIGITGRLTLEDCTTDNKALYVGASRFLHNFHHPTGQTQVPLGRNTFLGISAGNFTAGSTATSTAHASYNLGIGFLALSALTLGYQNVAIGANAGRAVTSGISNMLLGTNAGIAISTGNNNVSIGDTSFYNITTQSNNVAIGTDAGRYHADGATALIATSNSIYIGYGARGKNNSDSNSIVLGYIGVGLGANTTVIGNSSTTLARLWGTVDANEGLIVNDTGSATGDLRAESDTEANMLWLDASADTLYLGGSTNGVTIGKGATPILTGTAKYERHIQIQAVLDGNPANQPNAVDFFTAGGLQYLSTGSKYAFCQWEIPDDWDGTDIYFEVDWFPDSGAMSGTDAVRWTVEYRAIAEGEAINNGTSVTLDNGAGGDTGDYAQYVTKHSRMTLTYNNANQPLTMQDHVYFKVSRDTSVANDFGGTVTVPAYEIIYTSKGFPAG